MTTLQYTGEKPLRVPPPLMAYVKTQLLKPEVTFEVPDEHVAGLLSMFPTILITVPVGPVFSE